MPNAVPDQQRSVHLCALGTPVVVRFSGDRADEAAHAFREAWAWCIEAAGHPGAAEPVVIEASLDGKPEGGSPGAHSDVRALLQGLSSTITTTAIAAQAGRVLMLHACALADPETGATVVMVGPSGAGKTTMAATLGTSLGYLTDETAGILPDRTLLPYPKPLSLLTSEGNGVKDQVSPATMGLLKAPRRCHVAAVVRLERTQGAPRVPQLQRVPTVQALAGLGEQTSYLSRMVRPLHVMADVLDHCGGLLRVTYRTADDLRPLVGELMRRTG